MEQPIWHCVPRVFEVADPQLRGGRREAGPQDLRSGRRGLAGVAPQDIFFTDDIPGHVEGARRAGFDAVQYTTTPQLVNDLHDRGVRFNY